MKILVTGGAGFLGSFLVQALAQRGIVEQVIAFDNLSNGSFDYMLGAFEGKRKIRPMVGDILNSRKLDSAIAQVDVVIHAAKLSTSASIHSFDQVNNWGTSEVVAAVERSGSKPLIYIGDVAIYGAQPQENPLRVNATTPYELSMVRAESHVARVVESSASSIVRVGELVGLAPSKSSSSGVNNLVFKASIGEKLVVTGNGNLVRNITRLDFAAEIVWQLIAGTMPNGTYNVVSYSMPTIQLVGEIREAYPDLEVVFMSHHYENEGIAVPLSDGILPDASRLNSVVQKIKEAL